MSNKGARLTSNGSTLSEIESRSGLRLLATSDIHMQLTAWDYTHDRQKAFGGLTRLATLIENARTEAGNAGRAALLFDNGDGLQGTGLATDTNCVHPLMTAFASLRYDAIGLGNHDFDLGVADLEAVLGQSPCPVVCSNLHRHRAECLKSVRPGVILECEGGAISEPLRVGVLGALPPQTAVWNKDRIGDAFSVGDMMEDVQQEVARLRAEDCDAVVLLAHSGLGGDGYRRGQENAVRALARIDGLDAVFGGHSHLPFAGQVAGCPVTIPGPNGAHLGVIDLDLEKSDGAWRVTGAASALLNAAAGIRQNSELQRELRTAHAATRRRLARPVARTSERLHSFFSLVRPDALLHCLAEAQAAAARRVLAGTEFEGLPVISAVAPAKCGGRSGADHYTDIAPGAVLLRSIEDMVSFDNSIRVVRVTGAQLVDWMEMSASVFTRFEAGEDRQPLLARDRPAHGFDAFFGVSYALDLSQPARFNASGTMQNPAARRVRFCNLPPVADATWLVATNDYRVSGGGNVQALEGAEPLVAGGPRLRDAVIAWFRSPFPKVYRPDPWRFSRLGGRSAQLLTSPLAEDLLSEISELDPRAAGLDENGFLRVDLTL